MSVVEMTTPGSQSVRAERLPDAPDEFLQHEPADARARVDRRQDEERLEHDGEVIPVGHQAAHARAAR